MVKKSKNDNNTKKKKEKLVKKTYRTPQLQKDILDKTEWKDYGFVNDSDVIRRSVDRTLEELKLLNRNNSSPKK
jgi:hypothetical protein